MVSGEANMTQDFIDCGSTLDLCDKIVEEIENKANFDFDNDHTRAFIDEFTWNSVIDALRIES